MPLPVRDLLLTALGAAGLLAIIVIVVGFYAVLGAAMGV